MYSMPKVKPTLPIPTTQIKGTSSCRIATEILRLKDQAMSSEGPGALLIQPSASILESYQVSYLTCFVSRWSMTLVRPYVLSSRIESCLERL